MRASFFFRITVFTMIAGLGVTACTTELNDDGADDDLPWDPDRPDEPGDRNVLPYEGSNTYTLEAQDTLYTGYDLHTKVIRRSCSGLDGVCHNQKEFPDMRTAETFLDMIELPCNANPKSFLTVFNRCERIGDKLGFGDENPPAEVSYIDYVLGEPDDEDPDASSPGLHIYLREPLALNLGRRWRTADLSRRLSVDGSIIDVVYARHQTQWWVINATHIMAEVPGYDAEEIDALLQAGIRQGDHNRDGIYGADAGNLVTMLNPSLPEQSYLVARLQGRMEGDVVPGTRMPLANQPPTIAEMLALVCFIEGLPTDGSPASMNWPIDYRNCSYNENPEVWSLEGGDETTWSGRVRPLLQSNCGGCHGGAEPEAGLNLLSADAYTTLLGPSVQKPMLNFVEPGDPSASYLWQKLNNTPGISGAPMPQDPILGWRQLDQSELDDIETWILDGTMDD